MTKHFIPHTYQQICPDHLDKTKKAALFPDCGMGKTVVTETYLWTLFYDYFKDDVSKVLVIAPKKVAEDTWTNEQDKWDHLGRATFFQDTGNT